MTIEKDSPLRRLPSGLDRQQILCLDGIRIAADITDLAYHRLVETLLFALKDRETGGENIGRCVLMATMDAWTIIDATHRLRELLGSMPGLSKRLLDFQIYIRKTKIADDLRNYVQHFRNDITTIINANAPLWGVLTWRTKDDMDGAQNTYALVPRTYFLDINTSFGVLGYKVEESIADIKLEVRSMIADLRELVDAIKPIIILFERNLLEKCRNNNFNESDGVFSLKIRKTEVE
jgi:hypothetical protein